MKRISLFIIISVIYLVNGQIPAFGGCPDYAPMADFDKDKFMGTWFESERLFTVTELASKCVAVKYEKRPDGRTWIDNYITNRFTGVQRRISGTMSLIGKAGEAKYNVKYNSLPISYDTTLDVLETDYKNFAVIYSCSQIGPVGHTQSVWLMTRERNAPGPVIQQAYGVLDKYKITRTFFLKTDQTDCEVLAPPPEAIDPTEPTASAINTTIINTTTINTISTNTTSKPEEITTQKQSKYLRIKL